MNPSDSGKKIANQIWWIAAHLILTMKLRLCDSQAIQALGKLNRLPSEPRQRRSCNEAK
jgi:predicted secreted protein